MPHDNITIIDDISYLILTLGTSGLISCLLWIYLQYGFSDIRKHVHIFHLPMVITVLGLAIITIKGYVPPTPENATLIGVIMIAVATILLMITIPPSFRSFFPKISRILLTGAKISMMIGTMFAFGGLYFIMKDAPAMHSENFCRNFGTPMEMLLADPNYDENGEQRIKLLGREQNGQVVELTVYWNTAVPILSVDTLAPFTLICVVRDELRPNRIAILDVLPR